MTEAPGGAGSRPRPGGGDGPAGRDDVQALFGTRIPLVGMVHLRPLPGSPRWDGSMDTVIRRATDDVRALLDGGMDGVLVENMGDRPFHPDAVPSETVAAMTRVVATVMEAAGNRPVGINVLRNDPAAGVAIAAATGARFIRVNVHAGTMFTDQGLLHGQAHETLRRRRRLAPDLLILADVMVKHAVPPPGSDPALEARNLRYRGLADILLVPGPETGRPPDPARVQAVREAAPDAPVWIGSGLTFDSAEPLLRRADGAVVGTLLHREGRLGAGIDPDRVRRLVEVASRTAAVRHPAPASTSPPPTSGPPRT